MQETLPRLDRFLKLVSWIYLPIIAGSLFLDFHIVEQCVIITGLMIALVVTGAGLNLVPNRDIPARPFLVATLTIIAPLDIIRKRNLYTPEMERYLEIMEKASMRGASLIRQLMTFGRKMTGEFRTINLLNVVNDTTSILRETLPKMITLEVKCPERIVQIHGDPGLQFISFFPVPAVCKGACCNQRYQGQWASGTHHVRLHCSGTAGNGRNPLEP